MSFLRKEMVMYSVLRSTPIRSPTPYDFPHDPECDIPVFVYPLTEYEKERRVGKEKDKKIKRKNNRK